MRLRPRPTSGPAPWQTAVVIGAGYAGLVTARVLADHFREVVLLERDEVTSDTGVHPHTPQGHHAHAMLAKGAEVLERYFPGLRAELHEAGAPVFDYGEAISFLLPTGYAPRCRTGVRIQTFTRGELERRLRRRVLALPNVTQHAGTRCEGLVFAPTGAVTGVRYRTGEDEQARELTADLVVDAGGRSSPLDRWLREAGVEVPPERVVKGRITYTSSTFERDTANPPEHQVAYQMTFAPEVARGGVLMAVEYDRWTCSLFGYGDLVPPTDDGGYLDFARQLRNPHLAEQLTRRAEAGPVHRYTNVNSRWRPFHACRSWPARLLALGDSVCVFNPVYGQGLTVAALEADLLHRMLRARRTRPDGLATLGRAFQRGVARIVLAPWTLSGNSDLMWDAGRHPLPARFAHWYNTWLFAVATHDPAVWTRFARVINMVSPPTTLFHPAVAAKVLRKALASRRGTGGPPPGAPA